MKRDESVNPWPAVTKLLNKELSLIHHNEVPVDDQALGESRCCSWGSELGA